MALTISNIDPLSFGNKRGSFFDVAFDSAYAFGGEALLATSIRLNSKIDYLQAENEQGYTFKYDRTAKTVRVFQKAPPIVFEEKHTAVGGLITLDYPAAWIVNVCQAGQNMAWSKSKTYATLAANTFCIVGTIADGVRTQIYTDGATDVVYVTYVTQAWKEIYDLLVQEEVIASLSGAVATANIIMAFGFCELATKGVLIPIDFDDTTATGEIGVDYGEAAAASLDFAAADATQAGVITYLKHPTAGTFLANRFVKDENAAAAGADPFTNAFDFPLLLWCISGSVPVTGGVTQVLVTSEETPAAGEAIIQWGHNQMDLLATIGTAPAAGFVIGSKSNVAATAGAYIKGHLHEVPTVPLEVKNGTDLSNLSSVRMMALGI